MAEETEPDAVTLAWVQNLPRKLFDRVVRTGLTSLVPRTCRLNEQTIPELIKEWELTLDVQPRTLVNYRMATGNLLKYFGKERLVTSILPGEADKFRRWLRVEGRIHSDVPMSSSSVSRRCETIRELFQFAVRLKWIEDNPFGHIRRSGEWNEARNVYVAARLVDKIIECCEDTELAAMVALCRFCGFRGQSEFKCLSWTAVGFGEEKILIISPKTKRYPGGDRRIVPFSVCPKALQALNKLWFESPERRDLVFPRIGSANWCDVTQKLARICRDNNLPFWEKPWINMRASCENDWQKAGYSIFETAAWMGHSADIALRHYNRTSASRIADLPEAMEPKHPQQWRGDSRSAPESPSCASGNFSYSVF